MPRTPYVAANWKMHKTIDETEAFLKEFLPDARRFVQDGQWLTEIVVCPPFTSLPKAVEVCWDSHVKVGAQNMHEAESGAFTGEVSAPMLLSFGVDVVILGHSERRGLFGETDEALARKVPAALEAGPEPILCVGENEGERDGGETEAVLERQLDADLAEVADERLGDVVIAYEPIWAIGTGRTASPEQAQEALAFIRRRISARSADAADAVRILYGGSVKPDNAADLLGQADVDGALVGGASLDPADFLAIVEAAAGD